MHWELILYKKGISGIDVFPIKVNILEYKLVRLKINLSKVKSKHHYSACRFYFRPNSTENPGHSPKHISQQIFPLLPICACSLSLSLSLTLENLPKKTNKRARSVQPSANKRSLFTAPNKWWEPTRGNAKREQVTERNGSTNIYIHIYTCARACSHRPE